MSWRNKSSTYPSISLPLALLVCSHCLCITRFTQPLVLAYPPRDPEVEQWFALTNNTMAKFTQDRCHAFLHALLFTTLSHLKVICDDKVVVQEMKGKSRLATLASEFRHRMAEGRTFDAHGTYRTNFYDAVLAQAQKVMLPSFQESSS